jgi:hypothetical protein
MGLRYEHLIWPGSTVEEDPEARRSREWSRAKMAEDGFTPGDEW